MRLQHEFLIQKDGIGNALAFIRQRLNKYSLDEREEMQAELFAEEVMIRWANIATKGETVGITIQRNFLSVTLKLVYRGNLLDPMSDTGRDEEDETGFSNIGQQILIGLSRVQYAYRNGRNEITYSLKERGISPGFSILFALVTSLIAGLLFHEYFPATGSKLNAGILFPANQAFFGLLNAIAIPFLFISVVASLINMENISQMKTIFRVLFRWIGVLTILAAVIALAAGLLYFPIGEGHMRMNETQHVLQLGKIVRGIFPENIISPFLESNILQVIFLAFVSGITILFLKSRFSILVKVISELHQLLSTLLDVLCALMPLVIFASLFSILMHGQGKILLGSLGLFGMIVLCAVVFVSFCLITLALIEKEHPLGYLKKMGPVLLIALTTANSGSTFARHAKVATKKQGIRNYLVNFSIPVGALFSKPFMMLVVFMVTLFIGQFYHLSFGFHEFVSLSLLCILISVAVPPMPGMGFFLFSITLNRLGIPIEGLAMAVTLYTFLDYLLTAVNVFSVNISMLHTENYLRKKEENFVKSGE